MQFLLAGRRDMHLIALFPEADVFVETTIRVGEFAHQRFSG